MQDILPLYIALDVESAGATPGKYAMLAFGACVVGNHAASFYAELKPISLEVYPDSVAKAAQGLHCLEPLHHDERYDSGSARFDPLAVLNRLEAVGTSPVKAISEFNEWIKRVAANRVPIFVASPVSYHCMFIYWYFDNLNNGRNPILHFNGYTLDIPSLSYGLHRNLVLSQRERVFYGIRHNALDDAIAVAYEFESYLNMCGHPE